MTYLAQAVGSRCSSLVSRVGAALAAALLAAGVVSAQPAGAGRTDVVLVLDASGSMFNELEGGRLRITAAKEALAEFVSRLPDSPDLDVGLRVYGSRTTALEPDACEDSVLVVPVAGVDRELLLDTVRGTEPRGATPIAYSLELAAADLAGAPGRKVIVLVTDGEESCGGDVRAVAERLAGSGYEIDLHVIGFALTPLAQRSFEVIGTFQSANTAAELAAALGRAVELPPAPAGVTVTVRLTRDGRPATDGASVRLVSSVGDGEHALREAGPGLFQAEVPAGSYSAVVADAFADAPLTFAGLAVAEGEANEFAFELAPEFEVELTVSPAEPAMGSRAEVTYSGAQPQARAWITIARADAPDTVLLAVEGAPGASGVARVLVPCAEGELEARYHLVLPEGGTRVVGRSAPFTARAVAASLQAPDEVAGGTAFDVAWEGPDNPGDIVTVAPVGADQAVMLSYTFTSFGQPAELTAPVDPGVYEVRYLSGAERRALASALVTVTPPEVTLDAPAEVAAGAAFAVAWTGPNGRGDYVTVVRAGAAEHEYMSLAFTSWGQELELTAPDQPGAYEVRYFSGAARRVLASVPLTVR